VSNSAIAIRYAKALLNIAIEQNQVEKYADELASVAVLLEKEDLLRLLLDSPTFTLKKKTAIMHDLAELLKLSDGTLCFLDLLLEKGRIGQVAQIDVNYRRFADELSGVVRATIRSANELGADRTAAIKQSLEKQTGKQVLLSIETDEELIGGLQAEISGRLFDGSVKTQLKRMTETLAKG
jgi:F-type H+-transporting ATPase subunit delta